MSSTKSTSFNIFSITKTINVNMFVEKLIKTLNIQTGIYSLEDGELFGYAWFSVDDDIYGDVKFVVTLDGVKCVGKDFSKGGFVKFLSDDNRTVLEKWGIEFDENDSEKTSDEDERD